MKRAILAFAVLLGWAFSAWADESGTLTSLRAIHALSNAEASHALPVAFEATVTYYDNRDINLFVEDDGVGIFAMTTMNANLTPGDRVLVRGKTDASFRPQVIDAKVTVLHHGNVPQAVPVGFDALIRGDLDSMRVVVRGVIRSADIVSDINTHRDSIYVRLGMDGGYVDAAVFCDDAPKLKELLDAEVEIAGVAGGKFDAKNQLTGILLEVNTLADVKILKRAGTASESLRVTPMDEVLAGYHVVDQRKRVRVQGTITYFEPGTAVVLQEGNKSIWIVTQSEKRLHVGNLADATGFPDISGELLVLTEGEIQEGEKTAPIEPRSVSRAELASGVDVFDLVSTEGKVVAENRQAAQDEYILDAKGQVFSAIYHHPSVNSGLPLMPMKQIPIGSTVRVTGINTVGYSSNVFEGPISSSLLLRSFEDVEVIARPSWISVGNLILVVSLLALTVIAFGFRQWILQRKVHRQTIALAARIEAEAALERHMGQLEHRRSCILEEINGANPLAEIIEKITELVSFMLSGAPCWCEIADGARLGASRNEHLGWRILHQDVLSQSGPVLAVLYTAPAEKKHSSDEEAEALATGVQLVALAIETRRIYSDLRYRSEFDLLTDLHNRFSLDQHLDRHIEEARRNAGLLGLIYTDLDGFKQINDCYGHHVGDLYLQEAARRMKRQLRSGDVLARLGGDEFAALLPAVRCRADVEEVAQRLEKCFDEPMFLEEHLLRGSVSAGIALYPEDGSTKDRILTSADAAMYVAKQSKRAAAVNE